MNLEKLKGHIPDTVIAQIPAVMEKFQINTPLRLAHFLAQCGHESGGFRLTKENLNYSAKGLMGIFKKYFPNEALANQYARKPEKIANKVYGNRMGNGAEASGDGTTVTYTSQNNLAAGDVVNITGLSASAYNLSSATVATADKLKFTVTNAANAGLITGQYGKVQSTTALTAADGVGIGNILVPNVLGATTAVALDSLKDAGYEAANITTASAATNTRTDVTRFNATSATVAVIYATSANTNYPTGTKVTLVAGTPAGVSPVNLPAYALGTWTVTGSAGAGQITVSGSGFTIADTTGINATGTLGGANGTIKTQSTAGGATAATTATITITPWATAS